MLKGHLIWHWSQIHNAYEHFYQRWINFSHYTRIIYFKWSYVNVVFYCNLKHTFVVSQKWYRRATFRRSVGLHTYRRTHPICSRALCLYRLASLHMVQPCPRQTQITSRRAPRSCGLHLYYSGHSGIASKFDPTFFAEAQALWSKVGVHPIGCPKCVHSCARTVHDSPKGHWLHVQV